MIEQRTNLSQKTKVYTIAQAVLSSLGLITVLPAAGLLFILSLFTLVGGTDIAAESGPILIYTWVSVFLFILYGISLAAAILRLVNKPFPKIPAAWKKILIILGVLLFIVSLGFVFAGSQLSEFVYISSPFVLVLVLLPLLTFIFFGAKDLTSGSPNRTWGNITFNLSVTMPFIIFLELVLFFIIIVGIGVWVGSDPVLTEQLYSFQRSLDAGMVDSARLEEIVMDMLGNPFVLSGGVLVISVLVPLMEELFKPMAIWFLAGKRLTPAQGFVGGLIAGGCFALLETSGSIGIPTNGEWFLLLLGRTGTGLLHITLSGLVGWGFASAFYSRNWLRAIGNYLLAVLIHGSWNLFSLLTGIIPILPDPNSAGSFPFFLSQIGPYALGVISLINLIILFSVNRKLRRDLFIPQPVSEGNLAV